MNVSLNWLSDYVDFGDYSVDQLDDLLTFAGVEVEGISRRGVPSELIVVAEVKEAVQHENAYRL